MPRPGRSTCGAPRSCPGGPRGAAAPLHLVSALSLSGSRAPRRVPSACPCLCLICLILGCFIGKPTKYQTYSYSARAAQHQPAETPPARAQRSPPVPCPPRDERGAKAPGPVPTAGSAALGWRLITAPEGRSQGARQEPGPSVGTEPPPAPSCPAQPPDLSPAGCSRCPLWEIPAGLTALAPRRPIIPRQHGKCRGARSLPIPPCARGSCSSGCQQHPQPRG